MVRRLTTTEHDQTCLTQLSGDSGFEPQGGHVFFSFAPARSYVVSSVVARISIFIAIYFPMRDRILAALRLYRWGAPLVIACARYYLYFDAVLLVGSLFGLRG
ncbi:hypothetical protein GGS23DRAFT_99851 [Durotheca rogersii]|uniref:uncharacterized protein n=1 Tax=Durotheca rogersii TaxID=419775 RepID=UPI00221E501D|nr:uncharacterized protein GGS23DRAFT_99851 [Durotheca rogersii]KAI5862425.1 hypothetical protein GGS23DRAFT_99851 [Durotheca rogersii]